jgi:DHHC palmitoyltransferase
VRSTMCTCRRLETPLFVANFLSLQDEEAGEGGWFWNEQVASFRPPGALYCRECGVLIQDYDHLCPWTGTGIGRDKYVFVSNIFLAIPSN